MGIYCGNTRDKADKVDRVYVGAGDLATRVFKIYMGNESGEAELVWNAEEDSEEAMYEIMKNRGGSNGK